VLSLHAVAICTHRPGPSAVPSDGSAGGQIIRNHGTAEAAVFAVDQPDDRCVPQPAQCALMPCGAPEAGPTGPVVARSAGATR
jgi:hypothetical protein